MAASLEAEFRVALEGLEKFYGSRAAAARAVGVSPQLWKSWAEGGTPGLDKGGEVIVAWRRVSYEATCAEG